MRHFINIVESSTPDPIAEFKTWFFAQPWQNLAYINLERDKLEPNDIFIESMGLRDGEKKKGYGSKMIQKLIEIADKHGLPITLEASEDEDDEEYTVWLQSWYTSYGFEYHDAGMGSYGPFMYRNPKITKEFAPTDKLSEATDDWDLGGRTPFEKNK